MIMFSEGPRGKMQKIDGTIPTYAFSGELDETNVDALFTDLYSQIWSDWKKGVVLDFSKLIYLNSKAIGYLTDMYGLMDDHKWEFKIIGANENVYDILDIVGITKIMEIERKEG